MDFNNKEDLEKLLNFTFYISGECPKEVFECNIKCDKDSTIEDCVMCWRKALTKKIQMLEDKE